MHYSIILSTFFITLAHAAPIPDVGSDDFEIADLNTGNPFEDIVQDAPVQDDANIGNQIIAKVNIAKPVEGRPYPAPAALKCPNVEKSGSANFCTYYNRHYWLCDRGSRLCYFGRPNSGHSNKICGPTDHGRTCAYYTHFNDNIPISADDDSIWKIDQSWKNQGESQQKSPSFVDTIRCKFQHTC